jgi:hypothetical protein
LIRVVATPVKLDPLVSVAVEYRCVAAALDSDGMVAEYANAAVAAKMIRCFAARSGKPRAALLPVARRRGFKRASIVPPDFMDVRKIGCRLRAAERRERLVRSHLPFAPRQRCALSGARYRRVSTLGCDLSAPDKSQHDVRASLDCCAKSSARRQASSTTSGPAESMGTVTIGRQPVRSRRGGSRASIRAIDDGSWLDAVLGPPRRRGPSAGRPDR